MTTSMPPVSRPPSAAPVGGQITGQQRTVEPGPNNTVVPGYRIEFVTGKGSRGSVFVPELQYSTASVIAAVRALGAEMDKVADAAI